MTDAHPDNATPLPLTDILLRIADRLEHLCAVAHRLEETVQSDIGLNGTPSAELIMEIQSFDRLQQSMRDLGRLATHLARVNCDATLGQEEQIALLALLDLEETQLLLGAPDQTRQRSTQVGDPNEPLLF